MRTSPPLILVIAAIAAGAAGPLHGTVYNNNVQANTTVTSACTVSGTTLNFGNAIDPVAGAAQVDASSILTVQCTNTTNYTVALNAGTNAGGASNFSQRRLKSTAGNLLGYQLYLNNSRTTVWGDGTASSTYSGTGTGLAQDLTIYGRLPSLASAVPGTYTDTVTVTISY